MPKDDASLSCKAPSGFLQDYTHMMSDHGSLPDRTPTGTKHDSGKPRMELLSPIALEGIARVLAFGASKYNDENWRGGMKWKRIVGSLLRHTFKFLGGEDLDPESGLPHVDHIGCNAMFLCEYFRTYKDNDDRYKKEPV